MHPWLSWILQLCKKSWEWFKDLFEDDDEGLETLPVSREVRDLPPPEVVSRAEWGARDPADKEMQESLDIPVTAVVFHHTTTAECHTKEECCRIVREIQSEHMDHRRWNDIGYNFLIGGDARVYEGRGWTEVGAHTDDWNERSIGVAAIGNFKEEPPSDKMLDTIEALVNQGLKGNKYLRHNYSAVGHNQLESELTVEYYCTCPGDAFYEEIKYMPHWTTPQMLIEPLTPDEDEYDSLWSTPWYDSDSSDTDHDWSKGYDEDFFGPWEFNKEYI